MHKTKSVHLSLFILLTLAVLLSLLRPGAETVYAQLPTLPIDLPEEIPTGLPTINITPTITLEMPEFCDSWRVEIDMPVPAPDIPDGGIKSGAQELENEILSAIDIDQSPISVEVTSTETEDGGLYTIVIEGVSVPLLQQVLFVYLKPTVDVLGMPMLLTVTGQAHAGDVIKFLLTVIASTGSSWQLDDLDDVDKEITSLIECSHVAPGSPQDQHLDIEILEDGMVALKLLYKRAWEEFHEQFPIRVTLNTCDLPDSLNLSNPDLDMVSAEPPVASEGPLESESLGGVPSSFNWATSNNRLGAPMTTAIKNQSSCGSCWAFGSVGVLESAIKVQGGGSDTDLSEQYLVSCNQDGWSCNGGWWAHDYHINKAGKASNPAGAVLESSMPYSASNGTCTYIASHPYALASWHSVGDETLASVPAIKQAIHDYGPVAAAVCASSSFQSYSGGVYDKHECGNVNHAIILVGWDDGTESWVLRNSWGTGWGEGGYMRIKWGVNAVGYAANYVVLGGSPPQGSTPTNTSVPKSSDTPVPPDTDTPVPKDTDTPAPKSSDTPVPQQTNTTKPASTNTTQPTKAGTQTTSPQPKMVSLTPSPSKDATGSVVPAASDTVQPSSLSPTPTPGTGTATLATKTGTTSPTALTASVTTTVMTVSPTSTTSSTAPTTLTVSPTGLTASPVSPVLLPGIYDDTYAAMVYDGLWNTSSMQNPYQETVHYSSLVGDSVSFVFEGSSFSIGYTAHPAGGVAVVWIDDRRVVLFNQYRSSVKWQQRWDSPALQPGEHVVTMQHTLGLQVNIDYVEVNP